MDNQTRTMIARKVTEGMPDAQIKGIGQTANLLLQAAGKYGNVQLAMMEATKWAGYDIETVTACCYLVRARAV